MQDRRIHGSAANLKNLFHGFAADLDDLIDRVPANMDDFSNGVATDLQNVFNRIAANLQNVLDRCTASLNGVLHALWHRSLIERLRSCSVSKLLRYLAQSMARSRQQLAIRRLAVGLIGLRLPPAQAQS
jgi:hypothetical protein